MPDKRPPRGTFQGKNIMTPHRLGYFPLPSDWWAELSSGTGMRDDQKVYGVTVRQAGTSARDGRSKLCGSKREALDYIQSLQGDS